MAQACFVTERTRTTCKHACSRHCAPDILPIHNWHQMTLLHSPVQSHPFLIQHSGGKKPRPQGDDQQNHCIRNVAQIDCESQSCVLQRKNIVLQAVTAASYQYRVVSILVKLEQSMRGASQKANDSAPCSTPPTHQQHHPRPW